MSNTEKVLWSRSVNASGSSCVKLVTKVAFREYAHSHYIRTMISQLHLQHQRITTGGSRSNVQWDQVGNKPTAYIRSQAISNVVPQPLNHSGSPNSYAMTWIHRDSQIRGNSFTLENGKYSQNNADHVDFLSVIKTRLTIHMSSFLLSFSDCKDAGFLLVSFVSLITKNLFGSQPISSSRINVGI